jgi:hypothetical protein
LEVRDADVIRSVDWLDLNSRVVSTKEIVNLAHLVHSSIWSNLPKGLEPDGRFEHSRDVTPRVGIKRALYCGGSRNSQELQYIPSVSRGNSLTANVSN